MKEEKKFLRQILIDIVFYLKKRGLNNANIGEIINRDRAFVKRLIDNNKPKGARK